MQNDTSEDQQCENIQNERIAKLEGTVELQGKDITDLSRSNRELKANIDSLLAIVKKLAVRNGVRF